MLPQEEGVKHVLSLPHGRHGVKVTVGTREIKPEWPEPGDTPDLPRSTRAVLPARLALVPKHFPVGSQRHRVGGGGSSLPLPPSTKRLVQSWVKELSLSEP